MAAAQSQGMDKCLSLKVILKLHQLLATVTCRCPGAWRLAWPLRDRQAVCPLIIAPCPASFFDYISKPPAFGQFLESSPPRPAPPEDILAGLRQQARFALLDQNHGLALEALDKALALEPGNLELIHLKLKALRDSGSGERAWSIYAPCGPRTRRLLPTCASRPAT